MRPKAQATKGNINKWSYFKLKIYCTAKETISKMEGKLIKWKKYFEAIYINTKIQIINKWPKDTKQKLLRKKKSS